MTLHVIAHLTFHCHSVKNPMCCRLSTMFKIIVEKHIKCIMACDFRQIVNFVTR